MKSQKKERGYDLLRHPMIIVAAIIVGAIIGRSSQQTGLTLKPFGQLYLNLLVMCIIPLLFAAIISSLGKLLVEHRLGRQLIMVLLVFAVGMLLAATIGTVAGWLTGIGANLQHSKALGNLVIDTESTSSAQRVEDLSSTVSGQSKPLAELFSGGGADTGTKEQQSVELEGTASDLNGGGFLAYLTRLIPRNVVRAMERENYLGVLFFSVLMGVALGYAPSEGRASVLGVLETLFDALLRIINWVIYLLPLGLICIIAGVVAQGGLDFAWVLGKLIAVSVMVTAIAMILFALIIKVVVRVRLIQVFQGLKAPLVVAFATTSSMASIPAAMIALKREFGLTEENIKLLLPLGVMINPIGSALFFSLSAVFVIQLYAQAPAIYELDILLKIIIGSVLAGVAAMGLPATGALNMLGLILEPINIPPEVGIIALLAVTPIVDPLFTMVNVLGNCTATCILDRRITAASKQP